MAHVTRVSLAEQAADVLLDRVRRGEWPLGGKLPGENALAPQLGVGRSTVREAIRQLSGRGVLTTRQGAGVFVAALDVVDEWDVVVRRADILDVIEGRMAIESEAAALAAERRGPHELRAIRRALAQRENRDSREDYVDADMGFHRTVVAAAHNSLLLEMFDRFVPRLRESMIEMLRMRHAFDEREDHDAHAQLVDAIAKRDAPRARMLSREHLESLKKGLRVD